jgi:ABC-type amino acid transport substrate-binding protein
VEKVLDEMFADGTAAKIAAKYFGDASGVEGIR